jgi:hypothetical protein
VRPFGCPGTIAAAAIAVLAPLSVTALPGYGPVATVPSDVVITAFVTPVVTYGQTFNVQPGGVPAIWVEAHRALSPETRLTVGGMRLGSVVSGDLITAVVPYALFRQPGDPKIHIVELIEGRPSPSPAVVWHVQ